MDWLIFLSIGGMTGILLAYVIAFLPEAMARAAASDIAADESQSTVSDGRPADSPDSWQVDGTYRNHCGDRLAILMPLAVLASMTGAVTAYLAFGPTVQAMAAFGLIAALIAGSLIDIRHRLLPDVITLPLLWAGLLVNLGHLFVPLESAVLGAVAGYLSLWSLNWIFRMIRKIDGMGYGDFKLLAALGAWLGWEAIPLIIAISSLAASVIGIVLAAARRSGFATSLAFGPYLALTGAVLLVVRHTAS
ncbi:prepilin peptidase [Burkholderia pyrrocinia]|uniref:prepilin peptidase n=1 Tax=Burkholderia pyrrocinia TaxID=60550 RepID=UPI0010540AAA|nr:A24 family peptidase [Burkholderia pyrrocinia]TDA47882.1 prepilin peptidase [Burkholderia pyrrocinia]